MYLASDDKKLEERTSSRRTQEGEGGNRQQANGEAKKVENWKENVQVHNNGDLESDPQMIKIEAKMMERLDQLSILIQEADVLT